MSVEGSVAYSVIKGLWAPLLALLGWFFKSKITQIEESNHDLQNKVIELEKDLNKNYYDKQEIKEHIVEPLVKDMKDISAQVKLLSGMMNEIHQDVAILKYKILGEEIRNP